MDKSILAYDLKERVEQYDVDMDLMHPNRPKMVSMALDFLPFTTNQTIQALDLGVGTGFFAQKFLEKFPKAHVVALDGAASMIDLAKARLGSLASSVSFVVADFRDIGTAISKEKSFDVVLSSFALHHLSESEKLECLKWIKSHLKPGGWLLNADNIIAETEEAETRFQKLRVEGIVDRATEKNDEHFSTFESTRAWLDKMEALEGDKPLKLSAELEIIKNAGFKNIDILWKDYREVVMCGKHS